MTGRGLERLRFTLLGVALVVGVAVALSWNQADRAPQPLPTLPPQLAPKDTTQTLQGELIQFQGDRQGIKLRCRSQVDKPGAESRCEGVSVEFNYTAQGQPSTGLLTADDARYLAGLQKAVFKGHVVVTTADGFQVRTETLNYRGDKGKLRSDDKVEFARKSVSGSSRGFTYDAEQGTAEFHAEAVLRIASEDGGPPMDVQGGRAELDKQKGELRFFDGVVAQQGQDTLKAQRLVLKFAADRRAISGLEAFDDVRLSMSAAMGSSLGMAGGAMGAGRREITAPGLSMWFRPDRTPEEASAFFDAKMVLYPGHRDPQLLRTLKARLIVFKFDAQGRLAELQGQKDVRLLTEPLPGSNLEGESLDCKRLVARLGGPGGEIQDVDAHGDLDYRRGTRRASAETGRYEAASGELVLVNGQPTLEEQGKSTVTAARIELMTRSGDLTARGDARQVLAATNRKGSFMEQAGEATILSAETIQHTAAQHLTLYSERALLRSGRNEVRADRLRLTEPSEGGRRLEGDGKVFSLLHPGSDDRKENQPFEVRAEHMSYDERQASVDYAGQVALKQGQISTLSPKASLTLAPDGKSISKLVAGEPVELRDGPRHAEGRQATYTPGNQTIVVEGDPAKLDGGGQDARGQSLTFQLGDDRILIDGREEGRTETVFRKEPPKP